MLKLTTSPYVPGRPKGLWFKWKRDPNVVDAILMYAQRGHGKRSSFYSDYTFGVWKGNEIVPIGKAYFGFTDEELKQLDKWVRNNTRAGLRPGARGEKGAGVRGGLRQRAAIDPAQIRRGAALSAHQPHPLGQAGGRGGDARRHADFRGGHLMSSQSIERKLEELTPADGGRRGGGGFRERGAAAQRDRSRCAAQTVRKPPPGQMGLGTNIPVAAPPRGWKRPKKPDPMTTNVKPRGGSR